MAYEIERKFLVRSDAWRGMATDARTIRQGYLTTDPERTVRVRVMGDAGFITIKGKRERLAALEMEFPIPRADADELLDRLCVRPLIEKTRFLVPAPPWVWEVDVFAGDNAGLIVAEVEIASADTQVSLPEWVGDEVSGDPRYSNANLVKRPFRTW